MAPGNTNLSLTHTTLDKFSACVLVLRQVDKVNNLQLMMNSDAEQGLWVQSKDAW